MNAAKHLYVLLYRKGYVKSANVKTGSTNKKMYTNSNHKMGLKKISKTSVFYVGHYLFYKVFLAIFTYLSYWPSLSFQVWFQNRRSKERRMKQLSALGARRHAFFRGPRRMRPLGSRLDEPDLLGPGGYGYYGGMRPSFYSFFIALYSHNRLSFVHRTKAFFFQGILKS